MAGRGAPGGREKVTLNAVAMNAIQAETVKKERRTQKLYTEYNINPFHKVEVVAGKPMSWHDKMEDIVDDSFLNAIHHAALDPTKKYTEPQTTSQEVGWYSAPLINRNVNDRRLNFHRLKTEITEYMEAAWCQKEQSVNLQ
ncbi:cilia- and flagella-associated protein 144 isoform X2 [Ambystoma mexicanum]|uniref:cilia- and flagella-associated protein 144 isoform X2 n=1 Tax=Ambystoma mexicanum TaxID=8296 RepID=UPI0037E99B10